MFNLKFIQIFRQTVHDRNSKKAQVGKSRNNTNIENEEEEMILTENWCVQIM